MAKIMSAKFRTLQAAHNIPILTSWASEQEVYAGTINLKSGGSSHYTSPEFLKGFIKISQLQSSGYKMDKIIYKRDRQTIRGQNSVINDCTFIKTFSTSNT